MTRSLYINAIQTLKILKFHSGAESILTKNQQTNESHRQEPSGGCDAWFSGVTAL